MTKRVKIGYLVVALLSLAHYLLGHFAPKTPSQYDFSDLTLLIITVTVAIPYYGAWFCGVYAGTTLLEASETMQDKEDKAAFSRLSIGVYVLIGSFILATLVTSVRPYFNGDAVIPPLITIFTNYCYVIGPLIGVSFLYAGSGHLRSSSGAGRISSLWGFAGSLLFLLYSAAYLWLTFTNPTRQFSQSIDVPASYYLPDVLIVTTIILPFLISQVLILFAIVRLFQYYRGVSGLIYKRAAMNLIVGSLCVIGGTNVLQGLLSLGSNRLLGISLAGLLAIVYGFLFLTAFGYLYLAFAARKLATIERVMIKFGITGTNA